MTFPVPAREACQTLTHKKAPLGGTKKGAYMDKSFEKEEKELLLDIQKFYWEYLQEYMAREDADISTVNMGIGLLRGLIYISTKFHSDRSVGPSIIPSSLSQGM